MERLRQEALDLTGTENQVPVRFRQFFHTQDGNDILQFRIFLEDLLDTARDAVMLLTHDIRFQDTGSRCQRVDRRVDTLFHDLSGKDCGRVQMREGRRGSRVCQIVRRQ